MCRVIKNTVSLVLLVACSLSPLQVTAQSQQTVEFIKKRAESGNPQDQVVLAFMYSTGSGVEKDATRAVFWLTKAAEQDRADALCSLGDFYAEGNGVAKDLAKANECYRKAALAGESEAQFKLAENLRVGRGVPKDEEQSIFWYRKAAAQGLVSAQFQLASCYARKNEAESDALCLFWFRKAAELGHVPSQFKLGQCYELGKGSAVDLVESYAWYSIAAPKDQASRTKCILIEEYLTNSDFLRAQKRAGELSARLPKERKAGSALFELYKKAADAGIPKGMRSVGVCYKDGTGVEKDMELAIYWLRKAADAGDAEAAKELAKLGR